MADRNGNYENIKVINQIKWIGIMSNVRRAEEKTALKEYDVF